MFLMKAPKSLILGVLCYHVLRVVAECGDLSSSCDCPTNCSCTYNPEVVIHCDGHGSTTLPVRLPTNTLHLTLTDYNLPELDLTELHYLSRLESLVLSHNNIRHIKGTLEVFKNLLQLFLGDNELSSVSPKLFGNTTKRLRDVDLTGNPLKCDCGGILLNNCDICDCTDNRLNCTCNIKWLQEQVKLNPNVWVGVKCHNSSKDTDIRDVDISDFWCRYKLWWILCIAGVLLVLLLLCCITTCICRRKRGKSSVSRQEQEYERVGSEIDQENANVIANMGHVVTDEQLDTLAKRLGDEWESLAIHLGLTKVDVDGCKHENRKFDRQIFSMLTRWRSKEGSNATVEKLLEKLKTYEPPLDEEQYEFLEE